MKTLRLIFLLVITLTCSKLALGQAKETADALVKQGVALHDEGKYREAIDKYKDALKLAPDNGLALYELGYTLFSSGKGNDAIPYLEKALQINPDAGGAYDLLGSIYDDDKQPDKAIEYYLKGIKEDPDYQRLYYNLSLTYYRQRKYAEAEANAIKAITLDPKHPSSQRMYALATYSQNKLGRSLLAWCSFLLIEPQTKRSLEAMTFVKTIINSGIKVTGEKSVTLTINEKDLNTPNLLMPTAVLAATSDKSNLGTVDSLTLQLKSLFEITHEITGDKGQPFVSAFFSDYFSALGKSGNMPAFARLMTISIYPDENKKWFTEHDNELTALDKWITSTKRTF
ncbi:MAG: tetratricopeptide repeat protein [Bacteroidota bacterium]